MKFYRYFLDGIPSYLARHYWWAYLWRPAVWFFDHQMIINAILFGQYKKLMNITMKRLENTPNESVLQLTCVYGSLTPNILNKISPNPLHLADVALIQLESARAKVPNDGRLLAARMNAEQLGYKDNAFSTIVLFFLLHEMPFDARRRTLSECMRVLSSGGSLLLTEYAELPSKHFLYRFPVTRFIISRLEPFITGFWQEDLTQLLCEAGKSYGKRVKVVSHNLVFFSFYRVTEFKVCDLESD